MNIIRNWYERGRKKRSIAWNEFYWVFVRSIRRDCFVNHLSRPKKHSLTCTLHFDNWCRIKIAQYFLSSGSVRRSLPMHTIKKVLKIILFSFLWFFSFFFLSMSTLSLLPGRRPLQTCGHDRASNRTMVAIPKSPRQTIYTSQILREFVAFHLLHVQLCIRHVCVVGQAMVLGCEKLLGRLSTSGESKFPWYLPTFYHTVLPLID